MNTAAALAMLDAETMREAVAGLPACADVVPGSGELAASWVKPGRYFNTHYRYRGREGREVRASAFLIGEHRAARVAESTLHHTCEVPGELSCVACTTVRAGADVILQAFPWDYRLPTLKRCLDVKAVTRAADGLAEFTAAETRAYRPGMRCQIAYRTPDGRRMFGKVSVERRGEGYAFRTHRKLQAALEPSKTTIRVPAALAYLDGLHLTLVDAVAGTSLYDLIHSGRRPIDETRAAARALAAFHALESAVEDRPYAIGDEQELVRQWTVLCAELCSDLAPSLDECVGVLAETIVEAVAPRATLHRDFYDKQVLCLDDTAAAVIDMDTAAWGDPEIDVANFCAHLRLRALQHGRDGLYAELEDAFLGAYAPPLDPRRLAWYRRATLVRLACNYALRPRWRHIAPRVVALALEG